MHIITRRYIATIAFALVLSACSPTGLNVGKPDTPAPKPGLFASESSLVSYTQCDDFLDYVKGHAKEIVGPWGFNYGGYYTLGMMVEEDAVAAPTAGMATGTADSSRQYSGTNNQVAGIDEPDMVKTDGERMAVLAQGRLWLVDVSGSTAHIEGSLNLNNLSVTQMLMYGDEVVLVTNGGYGPQPAMRGMSFAPDVYRYSPTSTLLSVDISDMTQPHVVTQTTFDGTVITARLTGSTLTVVSQSGPVGLSFEQPAGSGLLAERRATAANRAVIDASTIENWAPYYVSTDADGNVSSEGQLVECANAYHPSKFAGLAFTTVSSFDLSDGDLVVDDAAGIEAETSIATMFNSHLYIATNPWIDWQNVPGLAYDDFAKARSAIADDIVTDIHAFDVGDGTRIGYAGSGRVDGYLLNQFAIDEHDGYLRVASTSAPEQMAWWGNTDTSESLVSILRIDDDRLTVTGTVGDLGEGERIYAVRFIGDVGYVVTFRQTDPLYTIDLSDPAHPRVRGQLDMYGYSAYLHPVDDSHLLGVGQAADGGGRTQGTQLALYDISDLDHPQRVDQVAIENSNSEAEWDHHGFLYWPETGTVVIPVQRYGNYRDGDGYRAANGAVAIRVEGDRLSELSWISHPVGGAPGPELGPDVGGEGTMAPVYEGWSAPIRRAVVIGGTLYTISDEGIAASDLNTYTLIGYTAFPPRTR